MPVHSQAARRQGTGTSKSTPRRKDDLRRVEQAITRISRIGGGKDAARVRETRSGIAVSRPGIAIMAALARNGELRVGQIARFTHLETPLVSRELNRLVDQRYALRQPDAEDGRAARVTLSQEGLEAYRSYRHATDEIIAATFADWRSDELHELASTLERVLADFARPWSDGHSAPVS